MAEDPNIFKPTLNPEYADNKTVFKTGESEVKRRLSFTSDKDIGSAEEPNVTCEVLTLTLLSFTDDSNSCGTSAEQRSPQDVNTLLKAKNGAELKEASSEHRLNTKQHCVNNSEDKENTATTITPGR